MDAFIVVWHVGAPEYTRNCNEVDYGKLNSIICARNKSAVKLIVGLLEFDSNLLKEGDTREKGMENAITKGLAIKEQFEACESCIITRYFEGEELSNRQREAKRLELFNKIMMKYR